MRAMLSVEISHQRVADIVGWYILHILKVKSTNVVMKALGTTKGGYTDGMKSTLGFGSTRFRIDSHNLIFRRKRSGQAVPAGYGANLHAVREETVSILRKEEDISVEEGMKFDLHVIVADLIQRSEDAWRKCPEFDEFSVYRWSSKYGEWNEDSCATKRSLESVVLSKDTKREILEDVNEFVSYDTEQWYRLHGIPYQRTYIFHGPPGTGKTSTITALTGMLQRHIYRLSLASSDVNDDSLLSALEKIPNKSNVLIEDIDSLFGFNRVKEENISVTFSGLLNCLDGISNRTRGLIFMMTTNNLSKLDEALTRPGRVDKIILLDNCSKEQTIEMFLRFYPGEHQCASRFEKKVPGSPSPAELQHHFVKCRKMTAQQCVDTSFDSSRHISETKSKMCYM